MIDAATYAIVAARLHDAWAQAGLVVERGRSEAGQLRYRTVPPLELLGHLMSLGYRLSLQPPDTERVLRLVHPEVEDEEDTDARD